MSSETTIPIQKIKEDEESRIIEAFSLIDHDGSGKVTAEKLELAAQQAGYDIEKDTIKELISKADKEGNESVNLEQFRSIMLYQTNVLP